MTHLNRTGVHWVLLAKGGVTIWNTIGLGRTECLINLVAEALVAANTGSGVVGTSTE